MQRRGLMLTISFLCVFILSSCGSTSSPSSETDWSWLGAGEGTYWYVPQDYIQAKQWNPNSPAVITNIDDQTVWHIKSYENGYVSGPVAVKLAGFPLACQYMIGSVTPKGEVHISFNAKTSTNITTGTGSMEQRNGAWTFNMQMASGNNTLQVAHWAFMLQCSSGQSCWNDIPGSDQTISELLTACE